MEVVYKKKSENTFTGIEILALTKQGDIIQCVKSTNTNDVGTILMIAKFRDRDFPAIELGTGSRWGFTSEKYEYIILKVNKMTLE